MLRPLEAGGSIAVSLLTGAGIGPGRLRLVLCALDKWGTKAHESGTEFLKTLGRGVEIRKLHEDAGKLLHELKVAGMGSSDNVAKQDKVRTERVVEDRPGGC